MGSVSTWAGNEHVKVGFRWFGEGEFSRMSRDLSAIRKLLSNYCHERNKV